MSIRLVPDEGSEPLSINDLQAHGTAAAQKIRLAGLEAVRHSMPTALAKQPWNRADLRYLSAQARKAAEAWNKVDALTSELLDQIDRSARNRKNEV